MTFFCTVITCYELAPRALKAPEYKSMVKTRPIDDLPTISPRSTDHILWLQQFWAITAVVYLPYYHKIWRLDLGEMVVRSLLGLFLVIYSYSGAFKALEASLEQVITMQRSYWAYLVDDL